MPQDAVAGAEHDASLPRPTVGSTFATTQAPYLAYLKSLEGWREAVGVKKNLCMAAEELEKLGARKEAHITAPDSTVLEILDIYDDSKIKKRCLRTGPILGSTRLFSKYKGLVEGQHVDTFLRDFRNCNPDVHTRVLLIQYSVVTDPGREGERAIQALLASHILGVELDLRPSEVSTLGGAYGQDIAMQYLLRHPMRRGFVSLGTPLVNSPVGDSTCIGVNLGRRKLGKGNPAVVVIHLNQNMVKEQNSDWVWGCEGGFWQPPAFSHQRKTQNSPSWSRHDRDATLVIRQCLRQCLTTVDIEDPSSSAPDGHWLAALLSMAFALYSGKLDEYAGQWHRSCESEMAAKDLRELWLSLRRLSATIRASIGQVEAFERDCDTVPGEHFASELRSLERILSEARSRADEVKDVLDSQLQLKSIEVSELSINESRSAIAVTVLAFFFVPLSLAASIFGMNVQEVNATGHGIGAFIVTAVVMLATSGLGWLLWRASRNWALVARAVKEDDPRWDMSTRLGKAKLVEEKFERRFGSPWRRMAAYIGLRTLEKRSVATLE